MVLIQSLPRYFPSRGLMLPSLLKEVIGLDSLFTLPFPPSSGTLSRKTGPVPTVRISHSMSDTGGQELGEQILHSQRHQVTCLLGSPELSGDYSIQFVFTLLFTFVITSSGQPDFATSSSFVSPTILSTCTGPPRGKAKILRTQPSVLAYANANPRPDPRPSSLHSLSAQIQRLTVKQGGEVFKAIAFNRTYTSLIKVQQA